MSESAGTPRSDEAGRVAMAIVATGPTSLTTFAEGCKVVLEKSREIELELADCRAEFRTLKENYDYQRERADHYQEEADKLSPSPAGPDALADIEVAEACEREASFHGEIGIGSSVKQLLLDAAIRLRSRPAQDRDAERLDGLLKLLQQPGDWQLRWYDRAHELPAGGFALYNGGSCKGYGKTERAAIDAAMSQQEPK